MASPNESKFNQNTGSPRFTTDKALGFEGGSTDPSTGNLVMPSYQQVSGVNAPPIPATPNATTTPSLALPKTSLGGQVLQSGAGAVAGEGAKTGIKAGGKAISNYFAGAGPSGMQTAADGSQFYSSGTLGQSFPATGSMSMAPGTTTFSGEVGAGAPGPVGAALDAGEFATGAGIAGGIGDAAGIVGGLDLAGATAGMAAGGAALGAGAAAAEGGSLVAELAPALLACFITEAVMSSGGQDNGIELETLRGFRDNILAKTPQGQAMIQEYEAIAPIVVEAVSSRPDGIQIFQQIKSQFIDPAVAAVQAGDNQGALQIYAQMIGWVTPFAAEAAQTGMGGGAQPQHVDAMNQMGDHATMVGNTQEVAGAAVPDTGTGDDDAMMAGGGMTPNGGMMPQQPPAMPGMMPRPPAPSAAPPNGAQWGPAQSRPGIEQTFSRRY